MSTQNKEQLGLTQDKDGVYWFRVRVGDRFLDEISSPYLKRIEKGLFKVMDTSVSILSILEGATQAYEIIQQKQAHYDKCLKRWEKLVKQSGNDNVLQSVDTRYAITKEERIGYEKHLALVNLQGAAKSRGAADQLLFPVRDYFQYKQ